MENLSTFAQMGLHDSLINSLSQMAFQTATPIQALTIDPILEGKDIFAQAETGSGKTGSFAIPLIEKYLRKEIQEGKTCLILSPTRELAQQTHKVINAITEKLSMKSSLLIGGENIEKQKQSLLENVSFLVATPGRLNDLVNQKCIDLKQVEAVVFDEADRLFDMGFKKEIESILKRCPKDRQLIMVSATSHMDVLQTAYRFHSKPLELRLNQDSLMVDNIDQSLAMITSEEKMPYLVNILREAEDAYALIFCNTQIQTHVVAEWLKAMKFKAMPISGRLPQNKRTRLMEDFRSKKTTILVCTDVAARGLDIDGINLVINYDLPHEAANYVHRIGRTGRAGKSGKAVSFCAHEDCKNLDQIYEYVETKIPLVDIEDKDFATDVIPKPKIDFKTLKLFSDLENEKGSKGRENKERKSRNARNSDRPEREPRKKREHSKEKNFKTSKGEALEKFDKKMSKAEQDQISENAKIIKVSSYQLAEAKSEALKKFRLDDESLLEWNETGKGSKKFWLFGPRQTHYDFKIKAQYKRLLTPFLIGLFRKAKMDIYTQVYFDNPEVTLKLSGSDGGLLLRNRGELIKGIENLAKAYLQRKIFLSPKIRIRAQFENEQDREKSLVKLVDRMKKKVLDSKKPVLLKPLNGKERRIVHQTLSDDSRFATESKGEGRLKRIEISLK